MLLYPYYFLFLILFITFVLARLFIPRNIKNNVPMMMHQKNIRNLFMMLLYLGPESLSHSIASLVPRTKNKITTAEIKITDHVFIFCNVLFDVAKIAISF